MMGVLHSIPRCLGWTSSGPDARVRTDRVHGCTEMVDIRRVQLPTPQQYAIPSVQLASIAHVRCEIPDR
jgi:hypothetical protein